MLFNHKTKMSIFVSCVREYLKLSLSLSVCLLPLSLYVELHILVCEIAQTIYTYACVSIGDIVISSFLLLTGIDPRTSSRSSMPTLLGLITAV